MLRDLPARVLGGCLARCNAFCDWCAGTYLDEIALLCGSAYVMPLLAARIGWGPLLLCGATLRCLVLAAMGVSRWTWVLCKPSGDLPLRLFFDPEEARP